MANIPQKPAGLHPRWPQPLLWLSPELPPLLFDPFFKMDHRSAAEKLFTKSNFTGMKSAVQEGEWPSEKGVHQILCSTKKL